MTASTAYRLWNQYDQLGDLIHGLSAAFIKKRHETEKWSIHENIAHLGRYHEVFSDRVDRILKNTESHFERYSAEADPHFMKWADLDTAVIVQRTKLLRNDMAQHLTSLKDGQERKVGVHPKFGELTLLDWTEFFLLHEAHHFYTIFRLIKAYST
ncbi:DinB family protein [Flavobacteriaceae bacterium 3-367]